MINAMPDTSMKENILKDKSFALAVRIVHLYRYLSENKRSLSFQNKYYEVALL